MIAVTVDESGTRRAVTKLVEGERLVSCSCCAEGDLGCCLLDTQIDLLLYPNGAITQSKLFPTIVLDGVTYSVGTLGYGDTTNGVFFETGTWAVYKNGIRTTRRCLISNLNTDIEDEFPDTLSLSYSAFGYTVTATLTRTSLCLYEGIDSEGCGGSLSYAGGNFGFSPSNLDSNGNNWFLVGFTKLWYDGFHGCGVGGNWSTTTNNNTPTGTYLGLFAEGEFNPVEVTVTITTP
jgi:hypothetical protein